MAMPRTPIASAPDDELEQNATEAVDASLLPPG